MLRALDRVREGCNRPDQGVFSRGIVPSTKSNQHGESHGPNNNPADLTNCPTYSYQAIYYCGIRLGTSRQPYVESYYYFLKKIIIIIKKKVVEAIKRR